MSTTKPRPRIDPVSQGFWDAARESRLTVQHCEDCDDRHYPGSPVCPNCLSSNQTWAAVSGRGTLLSWVRFHRAYWDSFRDDIPYAVILVGLEEGPLMISNLVGAEPETIAIGAPLEVAFDVVDNELALPKFRPAGAAA